MESQAPSVASAVGLAATLAVVALAARAGHA